MESHTPYDLPRHREEHVFGLFEQLRPGAAITFISAGPARETLLQLQTRYPGQFDWWPLEDGPDEWLILLSRRAPEAPSSRHVLEFMERDHERFFHLLHWMEQALREGRPDEVRRIERHLATGIRAHARYEEEVILPAVAERLGSPRGPAMVLRDQHLAISEALDRLGVDFGLLPLGVERLPPALSQSVRQFAGLMRAHVTLEQEILYGVADEILTDDERDAVVRRCQLV